MKQGFDNINILTNYTGKNPIVIHRNVNISDINDEVTKLSLSVVS